MWWAGVTEAASAAAGVSAGSAGGVAARPQGGLAGPGGRSWASATLRRPGRGAAASITGQSRRGPAGIGRLAQITAATPLMLVTWSRVRAHRMNPERSATVEPLALASWLRNAKAGSPKRPCDSKERAKKVAPWLAARAFHPAPLSASPRVAAAPGINAASTQFVELVGVISVQIVAQADCMDNDVRTLVGVGHHSVQLRSTWYTCGSADQEPYLHQVVVPQLRPGTARSAFATKGVVAEGVDY